MGRVSGAHRPCSGVVHLSNNKLTENNKDFLHPAGGGNYSKKNLPILLNP